MQYLTGRFDIPKCSALGQGKTGSRPDNHSTFNHCKHIAIFPWWQCTYWARTRAPAMASGYCRRRSKRPVCISIHPTGYVCVQGACLWGHCPFLCNVQSIRAHSLAHVTRGWTAGAGVCRQAAASLSHPPRLDAGGGWTHPSSFTPSLSLGMTSRVPLSSQRINLTCGRWNHQIDFSLVFCCPAPAEAR